MKKTMKACLLSLCTGLAMCFGSQNVNAQVEIEYPHRFSSKYSEYFTSYCIPEHFMSAIGTQFLIPQIRGESKYTVYNSKFERVRELDISSVIPEGFVVEGTQFINLDQANMDYDDVVATQTLFNDDDLYEFILISDEQPSNHIKIINEKGKIIREFSDPEAYRLELEVLLMPEDEKRYIVVAHEYQGRKDDCWKIYEIDASTSSVREVQSMPISIKPRAARKSETITMTLPQKNSARQVVLTAADGKQIADYKLAAGEHKLHINTSSMPQGVNIYSVYENGTKVDSGKILIH